jgi:hypothetical protein
VVDVIKKLAFIGKQAVVGLLLLCVVSSSGAGFVFDHGVAQAIAKDDCPCSQQRCCIAKADSQQERVPAVPVTTFRTLENSVWALSHYTLLRPAIHFGGQQNLPLSSVTLIDSGVGIYQLHCSYLI